MLKAKLSAERYESADESIQKLYKKSGDDYVLQVEGMTTKDKLDEFRDNNVELMKQLEKLKDIDLDEYKQLKKEHKEREMEKLSDSEKFEVERADWQAKLDTANKRAEDAEKMALEAENSKSNYVKKFEIDNAAHKAFAEHKIRPELQDSLTAEINAKFTVKEGQVVAMDGDKIIAGANGNLSISEFVSSKDDVYKIPSSGGNGAGGGGDSSNKTLSSHDKIKAGLAKMRSA